jgi:hypothetical protein
VALWRLPLPVSAFERAASTAPACSGQRGRRAARGRRWRDCGGVTLAVVDPRAAGRGQDAGPNLERLRFAGGDLEVAYARATAVVVAGGCAEAAIAVLPWGERSFVGMDHRGNRLCFVQAATDARGAVGPAEHETPPREGA